MSKKLVLLWLASMDIFKLFSANILQICFFIISVCLGVLLQTAQPLSRYNPTLISSGISCAKTYSPTNASAPSKLPIVTSKSEFLFFDPRIFCAIQ